MRELYIEGLASHGGPESCVGRPRGRRRSVDRGGVGSAIEPRNQESGVLTLSPEAEGNTVGRVLASGRRTLRGLRTDTCAESPCSRTERSHGHPGAVWRVGREGNAEAVSP
jgi:hypothetical protein